MNKKWLKIIEYLFFPGKIQDNQSIQWAVE